MDGLFRRVMADNLWPIIYGREFMVENFTADYLNALIWVFHASL